MMEPIALQALFFGTLSGAAVVLCGALYALFFALGRIHGSVWLSGASALAFLFLLVAVYVLIQALALSGFWIVVTLVMLLGYYVAPRAIWRLCVGTHGDTESRAAP